MNRYCLSTLSSILTVAIFFALSSGCSVSGEPCLRNSDCPTDRICLAGHCVDPSTLDAGVDADGWIDADADAAVDADVDADADADAAVDAVVDADASVPFEMNHSEPADNLLGGLCNGRNAWSNPLCGLARMQISARALIIHLVN